MSNFFKSRYDDKTWGNADCEAKVKTVEGQFCDSQMHFLVI